MNSEEKNFILAHLDDDPERLLLSARRYAGVDVPWCVDQIAARRQLRDKVPEWYACPDLIMSGRVPAEQCSSELTARMKRVFVAGDSLCDLTGGMGVDLWYMSQGMRRAVCVERNAELLRHTRHNIETLLDRGETHTSLMPNGAFCPEFYFVNRDCRDFLADDGWQVDTIYIDPARRAGDGSRVYDLTQCEPNVVELLPQIFSHCRTLVIKLSPMFDIARVGELIPYPYTVGVTAVRNECKELLLCVTPDADRGAPVRVVCQDYTGGRVETFVFDRDEEAAAGGSFSAPQEYLYVPDVTLLKAGAFRTPCARYGLSKLDANTHLYTSGTLREDFFGRVFHVEEALPFSSRVAKDISRRAPQANVAVRNFPLTAEQLKKKLGVRDGGEDYLYGTTVRGLGAMLLRCRRVAVCLVLLLSLLLPEGAWARRSEPVPDVWAQCADLAEPVPVLWPQGKPFVATVADLDAVLRPEEALSDTARRDWRGSIWRFDAAVVEEDWLGQRQVWLRFLSPSGRYCRYETGRPEAALADSAWHPRIPGLLPLSLVERTDSILRGRKFYLRIDDERLLPADSLAKATATRKFCPVTVDSVSYGTDEAPLRVWFTRDSLRYSVLSDLPGSTTATGLDRYFTADNPRAAYPDLTDDHWELICTHRLVSGMTAEEVRLSWGRPYRYETTVTSGGPTEVWHYRNGRSLLIVNGRLQASGINQ